MPAVLWLNAVSDAIIALAYFTIPIALIVLVKKRSDLAFSWMFLLFGLFILACGTTHVMGIITIWKPFYWLDGLIKAITAFASIATAILIWPLIPKALAVPSSRELAAANALLLVQAERQAAVSSFSQEALLGASHEELMQSAATFASRGLGLELSAYFELEESGDTLLLRAGDGWKEAMIGTLRLTHDLSSSQASFTLAERRPVIAEDLTKETRFTPHPLFLERGVTSGITVIVHGRSRLRGVLGAYSQSPRTFTDDDVNFLQAVANVLGIAQERKQAEEQVLRHAEGLAASNRELEAFSYSVSHDLRAPLRSIDGFSRMLVEDCGTEISAEGQRFIGIIRKNATHMGHLIDDLLSFSRLGKQSLDRRLIVMDDLVRQAIEDLQSERLGRSVSFEIEPLPAAAGDPALLRQVFVNLIGNALKYSRGKPEASVVIGSFREDDAIGFFVKDNGVGFDMRYADKIFGVFQRLHRSEDYEGTGVGLAIVQRIVQRHGGRVWVEATIDQGATFSFTLPSKGAAHEA